MKKTLLLTLLASGLNASCNFDKSYEDYLNSMVENLGATCQQSKSLMRHFLKDKEPKGILKKLLENSPFEDKSLEMYSNQWREINE